MLSWRRASPRANARGLTVWVTGLPGSGKTSLADALAERLMKEGHRVERLDADVIRGHLWKELGYSKEDRDENIRRVTFLARLLTRNGVVTIASFISPYAELRAYARQQIGDFIEVYVKCPVEVCMQRDLRGLYRRALAGEIGNFTGVSDPYEEPLDPEVLIESDRQTVEESVSRVMDRLRQSGYI